MIMNTYLSIANNTVTINNIYKSKCKDRIISEIIDALLLDADPIFIELFKEDGVNIKKKEIRLYKDQIDAFFLNNGCVKSYNQHLLYARAKVSKNFFLTIPYIFDFYQEVTFFVPSITWKDFEKEQSNYLSRRAYDYLPLSKNGIVFQYLDSSDFSICCSENNDILKILAILPKSLISHSRYNSITD